MLKIVKTTVEREEGVSTYTSYDVEGFAVLDGTSLYESDMADMRVNVTHIGVTEYDDEDCNKAIYVTHDAGWQIYTDRGFEQSISAVLGFTVTFTEQGMQEDGHASME
jgi:hypothetical protein